MINFLKKIKPEWPLRLGFGAMYCYSGIDLIRKPSDWYGFAPRGFVHVITQFTTMDTFLRLQGASELLIGLVLLAWFLPRITFKVAALFGSLEIFLILIFAGIDTITFRDMGLFGGFLSLAILALGSPEI